MNEKEIVSSDQTHRKESTGTNTVHFSGSRKEMILAVIIVFCLPVLLYLQTIKFGFTKFDDDKIIENHLTFLSDFKNVPKAFETDAFTDGSSKFYRPLQVVSYMTDIKLSGGNSTLMYHLSNVLLLGGIAVLLFLFLQRMLIPVRLALLSTLVFCAHPLFVSNIAWIPARGDLQLMLFSLLSFLFLIDFLQKKKILYLAGHLVAFTLALFCKETAMALPILFILYYFTYSSEKLFEKQHLITVSFYAIIVIGWFLIRSKAIGGELSNSNMIDIAGQNESFGIVPVLRNLQTIPECLSSFFIPIDIDAIPNFSLFKTLTGSIIIILIGIVYFRKKSILKKEKLFCFIWFLLLLLPTMLYKHDRIDYLQHRFFLPLTGILLFTLLSLPEQWVKTLNGKLVWILVLLFFVFSSGTFITSRSYTDPVTFYDSAISQNPKSYFSFNNRGFIYFNQRQFTKAINDFTSAVQLKPDFAQAYYNRGYTYYFQGSDDKAIDDYSKAIDLEPKYIDAYNNRAAVYLRKGLYSRAIVDCSKAIELNPGNAMTYCNRGALFLDKGMPDRAIDDCTKALQLRPDYAMAFAVRGDACRVKGDYDSAISDYSRALVIQPTMADIYNNRGIVYRTMGFNDKACHDFNIASRLGFKEAKSNIEKFCR